MESIPDRPEKYLKQQLLLRKDEIAQVDIDFNIKLLKGFNETLGHSYLNIDKKHVVSSDEKYNMKYNKFQFMLLDEYKEKAKKLIYKTLNKAGRITIKFCMYICCWDNKERYFYKKSKMRNINIIKEIMSRINCDPDFYYRVAGVLHIIEPKNIDSK